MLRSGIVLLLLITISACGFRLAGTHKLPATMQRIAIIPNRPYNQLQRALATNLQLSGATLIAADQQPQAIITIVDEQLSQHELTANPDGVIREDNLMLQVKFKLQAADGTVLLAPQTISTQRRAYYNPNELLSSKAEARIVANEMRRAIANQIVLQIAIVSQKAVANITTDLAHEAAH